MSKRTNQERIERYKRKLQELEGTEVKNKRRRYRLITSSDESYVNQDDSHLQNQNAISPEIDQEPADEVLADPVLETQADEDLQEVPTRHTPQTSLEGVSTEAPSTPPPATSDPTTAAAPDQPIPPTATEESLDPLLLAALGESTSDTPDFGPSIHDSLANIWLPLLRKGMTKENKEKLLREYLIPSNCKLLQAPKLNAEISAAISEVVRGRDKKYVCVQQQLGQGITAVNRAMDVLLKSDNKLEALKYLSDGCRILSDLHNFFTKDRTKLITPSLDKSFLQVIQDAERDESLFGNTLPEKIKASKAIERQSHQIKKSVSTSKANTPSTSNTRPFISQGNWSGPPRYSSNRGGRGGNRKTNPPTTRRPYINTAASTRPQSQSKPRAPARQH